MKTARKPVVVFAINQFGVGGAQRLLVQVLSRLEADFQLHLFVLQDPVGEHSLLTELPDTVVVHQFAFDRMWRFRQWWRVFAALRTVRPQAVSSHLFLSNTVLRVVGRWLGIPVIACEHNTVVHRRRHHVYIERILAQAAEPIIAVSEEVADAASRTLHIPRSTYQVIMNGIDLQLIDDTIDEAAVSVLRAELGLAATNKVALSVGRCVKQKRLDVLIAGFAQFAKTHLHWRLIIVGEGNQRTALEAQVQQLQITDQVYFVGLQPNPHLYYQLADCLVSTSDQEGMSIVQLEALAHGLPIISTPTGGTSAIIKPHQTGLFITQHTAAGVSQTLQQFAADTQTNWRQHCLDHREGLSIDATADQYKTLLMTYARP